MAHVFISYSRHDTAFVERLESDLNARGIQTWRDTESIVGGEEWYNAILNGIHGAYALLQIVTVHSNQSRWVKREALYADQQGLPIIPILPETCKIPFHLIEKQPVLCDDDHHTNSFSQLITALNAMPQKSLQTSQPTGLTDNATRQRERQYLQFLLAETHADLQSALYVGLVATPESSASDRRSLIPHPRRPKLDRLGLETVQDDQFDRPGQPVPDARIPIRRMPRVLLLGEPGSGKTTTLLQLAIDMAREAENDPQAPLPVFVPLRHYQGDQSFTEFVRAQLGLLESQFDRLAGEGRLIFLCDALNEMPRQDADGKSLIDDVRGFLFHHERWIVSCRVRDYQEDLRILPDVRKIRLQALTLPRILEVIEKRFFDDPDRANALWQELSGDDDLLSVWNAYDDAEHPEAFWSPTWHPEVKGEYSRSWRSWRAMHHDERQMMRLCRNPYMLYLVCEIFDLNGSLPANRGALFATFVDDLLAREETLSHETGLEWINTDNILAGLADLAFTIQQEGAVTEIPYAQALDLLPDHYAELLLRIAASASLINVGETVRFSHQLLQEYFASEIMGEVMDRGESASRFFDTDLWWEQQGWEETAIILAGVRGNPATVAAWIAPSNPELAYHVLIDSGIQLNLNKLDKYTRQAIVHSAYEKSSEANPIGRATAFRVLGLLNADERSGIGVLENGFPDIDWCQVPSGPFFMGGDPEAYTPWDGAEISIDYDYWVAKFPVTYAQYEAFVSDGGYEQRPFWSETGWYWRENWTHPRSHWHDPKYHLSNHPLVGLTWYEAVAFSRWLNTKLHDIAQFFPYDDQDYEVRLLSEAEWEKAARGTDQRAFTYGDQFNPYAANTAETGIGRTCAVGILSSGTSPYGVEDMSGNVWEWCISAWHSTFRYPENIDPEHNAPAILRGGSWLDNSPDSRCATRYYRSPRRRSDYIGFRVGIFPC